MSLSCIVRSPSFGSLTRVQSNVLMRAMVSSETSWVDMMRMGWRVCSRDIRREMREVESAREVSCESLVNTKFMREELPQVTRYTSKAYVVEIDCNSDSKG
jgi:hypothetical protein